MPGMDDHFLDNVKQTIKQTPGLTVKGLAQRLGKSEAQTYRILKGEAPYHIHYTRIIRNYVGVGSRIDRDGDNMAVIDLVDLKSESSFELEEDVICRMTFPEILFPARCELKSIKLIVVTGDHCAPDYRPGDYVFVDTAQTAPEPPGVFLLWTGMGFRLQFCEHLLGSNPVRVRLSSLNTGSGYGPVECTLDDIHLMGRIIGKISVQRD